MKNTQNESTIKIEPTIDPGAVEYSETKWSDSGSDEAETLEVKNTGDHIVQVGSHYHFLEVNPVLAFDRARAHGTHLNIPSGDRVYFPPGQTVSVDVTPFEGNRRIRSFYNTVDGDIDELSPDEALLRFKDRATEPVAELGGSNDEVRQ